MLFILFRPFADQFILFNLFRYITFRAGAACLTALIVSFLLGSPVIRWLKSVQRQGQPIRLDGPERHLIEKKGTPTMGGLLILGTLMISTLLWVDLRNGYIWPVLFVTLSYGALGFCDDYLKVTKLNTRGVHGRMKLFVQAVVGFAAAVWITSLARGPLGTALTFPVFKEVSVQLGFFFPVFGMLVMMGASNAVNLTDGLDGLAIVPTMIAASVFALIAYLVGNRIFADYLQLNPVVGAGELAVFCSALVGSGMGFLWFNAPPAAVFMGDIGSLALGGALGAVAMVTKHEIVLMIVGGLFVVETLSVVIQVFWFKRTGTRVFLMAPLHHHFEKKGWAEPTIVIRFWIISMILALVGLATLKNPMTQAAPNPFPSTIFSGKRFAVVGLGKNGRPAAVALQAMGAEVVAWDDDPAARIGTTGLDLRDPAAAAFDFDALVLSPGIPHRLPKPHRLAQRAIDAGVPILSDVELLFQAVRASGSHARFAGITGTNGKSTTTALLAHILSQAGTIVAAGANLGPAALSLPLLPQNGVYALEMSSYMLERLETLRFDVAVMLNLSADHIDRHGDMGGYAAAKRAIFDRQRHGDLAVIGIDDEGCRDIANWLDTRPAQVVRISGASAPLAEGPALPGEHNAQNAAAAAAAARFLGVSDDAIAAGLLNYPGLPHRQQLVVTIDGIGFVNDSKATNADAAARALACYDRVIWIAGGTAKEGGIEPLAPLFPRIAKALLIGRDAPGLAAILRRHGVPFDIVNTLDAAVPAAFAAARTEDAPAVLLSPACASWDQFSGYDQRGDRFASLALSLRAGRP